MKQKTAAKKLVPKKMVSQKQNDIIQLILEDHKPLKKLIKTLKDPEADIEDRRAAFEEFAPLLVNHAKPEEESLYIEMKQEDELRSEAMEGDVEHALADQLVEEVKRAEDEDLWSAKVKVLAELVEHHIEEEEKELLPDYKKNSTIQERVELGEKFLALKAEYAAKGNDDAPSEELAEERPETQRYHAQH